jgi:hypothetical protein
LLDPAGTLPGTPVAVATITGYSFDGGRDRVDVTPLGATNKRSVQGLPNYSGSFTANWDSADLTLIEAAMAGDPVVMRLVPDNDTATTYLGGLAYIDFSLATSSTSAVAISGSFTAAGDWTLTQAP